MKFYYEENTHIAAPGECCTESFIVAYSASCKSEIESFKSYLFTRVVRFLLLQAVVSQDVTRAKFLFVPALGTYDRIYTDEWLCNLWGLTEEDYLYIKSRVGAAVKSDGD